MLKILCVLVYSCTVLFVPEMPNIYSFVINSLAIIISTSASVLLFCFLNTRPIEQKNLLNRILVLLTVLLVIGSLRNYIISFIACFWHHQLKKAVETNPLVTAGLLSVRPYTIMECVALCALSAGRLLLFINPVVFHKIQPTSAWAIIVGILAVVLSALDFVFGLLLCKDNPNTNMMKTFKAETGILDRISFNVTYEEKYNNTELIKKEDVKCQLIPTLPVLMVLFILLETSRVMYIIRKDYLKKPNKVDPTVVIRPPRTPQILHRSKSLPSIGKSSNTPIQRRFSLHGKELKPQDEFIFNAFVKQKSPAREFQMAAVTQNVEIAKKVLIKQFMRTASFITISALIGFTGHFIHLYSSVGSDIIMCRTIAYVLVVLLVVFDKDILLYASNL